MRNDLGTWSIMELIDDDKSKRIDNVVRHGEYGQSATGLIDSEVVQCGEHEKIKSGLIDSCLLYTSQPSSLFCSMPITNLRSNTNFYCFINIQFNV